MPKKRRTPKWHYGWIVVSITFIMLLVSAGIRSMPSILMIPLEEEFGWSRGGISGVVSVGIFLYVLVGPFSAALLERFGIRRMFTVFYGLDWICDDSSDSPPGFPRSLLQWESPACWPPGWRCELLER